MKKEGRVYAFSLSLLIINVSQVRKIASRSFCSILPFFLSPSGFPFPPRSLRLLPTSLAVWASSPSQSISKHRAEGGDAACSEERKKMLLGGGERGDRSQCGQDAHIDSVFLTSSVGRPGDSVLP